MHSGICQPFYNHYSREGILDPLIRFKDAHVKEIIPDDVYNLVLKRFPIVVEGVNRIEKASGIQYPVAYVEPSVVVSSPDIHS